MPTVTVPLLAVSLCVCVCVCVCMLCTFADRVLCVCVCCADKQQELDLPTVTVEQVEPAKERPPTDKNRPMSQISGIRKLKHTNSFAGVVPKYGVETPHTEELGKVGYSAGVRVGWALSGGGGGGGQIDRYDHCCLAPSVSLLFSAQCIVTVFVRGKGAILTGRLSV